ncbi:hypothetical protein J7E88_35295 [Streptomyces sp. ISL-10]|uniref:DUF7019 family protein n=1 Tax=Streptomyces sp. ISL-10 TaxID=2819172 RepID=UPI001BE87A4A|nr:hypothetical protein [Streptomyces sp. ISL-10]MBT2370396.1 hypothetical protein [Streptomyces sp. ISL-10]
MTQGGDTGRYLYWSDRRVRAVAEEVGLVLERRWQWSFTLSLPMTQLQIGEANRARNRLRIAQRLLRKLGPFAASTFDAPPSAPYIQGTGHVEFAEFVGNYAANEAVLCHIRTHCAEGRPVDVVLFGSMEHVEGFRPGDALDAGWVSSAAPAIEELLRRRGTENTWQWDDDQSRAVEALKIAVQQGQRPGHEHEGQPWTRGYPLGHDRQAHWCAEVYADVVLDDARWNLDGELGMADAHRIVIGAPLWVRALRPDTIVRYQAGASGWFRCLLGRRPAPALSSPSAQAAIPAPDRVRAPE